MGWVWGRVGRHIVQIYGFELESAMAAELQLVVECVLFGLHSSRICAAGEIRAY